MDNPATGESTSSARPELTRSMEPQLGSLHDELDLAFGLFRDGHYDEALRKASQRFINRIQELVNRPDLDGTGLIEKSFSSQSPLLAFSNRETQIERDEHDGFRFLAAGMTRALRNVLTHHDNYGLDATTASEWLAFVSAMHRRLDEAEQIAEEAEPDPPNEPAD